MYRPKWRDEFGYPIHFHNAKYQPPSGGAAFYKCASVNSSAQTWTGYKAVLANGEYSFESTPTTGLSYTTITPEVGKIYTADALAGGWVYGGFPSDYVYYNDLDDLTDWTVSGATLVSDTDPDGNSVNVFHTAGGSTYAYIAQPAALPLGNNSRTMAFWFRRTESNGSCWAAAGYGASGGDNRFTWSFKSNYIGFTFWGHDNFPDSGAQITDENWHHIVCTWDSSTNILCVYVDAVLSLTWATYATDTDSQYIHIGDPWECYAAIGNFSSFAVWNRVLSSTEILGAKSKFRV